LKQGVWSSEADIRGRGPNAAKRCGANLTGRSRALIGDGRAEIFLSGRDERALRAHVGPAGAELLTTEYHGSKGSAALSGRHVCRFQLADLLEVVKRALG
jgi:hypothetical protein